MLTIIRGAGDIASGIALRLRRAGIQVVMTELALPTTIRRTVAFSDAVVKGKQTVEEVTARRAENAEEAARYLAQGILPVLVDPACACREQLKPEALVDAILAKRNLGTVITDAPIVWAWARASRRALTVTRWWRPCAGTRWAASFMKAAPCPTPTFPA